MKKPAQNILKDSLSSCYCRKLSARNYLAVRMLYRYYIGLLQILQVYWQYSQVYWQYIEELPSCTLFSGFCAFPALLYEALDTLSVHKIDDGSQRYRYKQSENTEYISTDND